MYQGEASGSRAKHCISLFKFMQKLFLSLQSWHILVVESYFKEVVKMNPMLKVCIISVLSAVVSVVILKYVGHENPAVIGGGVAGGVAGAITASLFKRKK